MEEKISFASLGRVEAIRQLYEGSGYSAFAPAQFKSGAGRCESVNRLFCEGVDFDLTYFPLKHLGYKSVVVVSSMLYAAFCTPKSLHFNLAISAKLDFEQIKEFWSGVCSAAKDYGYTALSLDLSASVNGFYISVGAEGFCRELDDKRRPKAKSMDLVCLSGNLGGAFMGLKLLESEKENFAGAATNAAGGNGTSAGTTNATGGVNTKRLEKHKRLVGDYLKPNLDVNIPQNLADGGFYPTYGYCIDRGLSDAIKRLQRDSGLGVKIYVDKIPFGGGLFDLSKEMGLDAVSTALNGGEDYRILFTLPLEQFEKFRHDFQTWQVIGHLAKEDVGAAVVMPDGLEIPMRAQGWKKED
ncbi:MAG: hypothetical protein IIX64_03105 [Bacteroidales bacterium]|nr:hypothetical protein [Bacteroidales bacterium]